MVGTRRLETPDLYRVNSEVNNLKPFPYLAFPQLVDLKIHQKRPSFDGELRASFSKISRASESMHYETAIF